MTYGYTAAGFSGRMPCAELADSIVQCGRNTLEKAISFVNANHKWKAKVIYGDTDRYFFNLWLLLQIIRSFDGFYSMHGLLKGSRATFLF